MSLFAIPLLLFAAELLAVLGFFKLIVYIWPTSFVGRGLTVLL